MEQAGLMTGSKVRTPTLAIAAMLLGAGVRLLLTHADLLGETLAQAATQKTTQHAAGADAAIAPSPERRAPDAAAPVVIETARTNEPREIRLIQRSASPQNNACTLFEDERLPTGAADAWPDLWRGARPAG